MTEATRTDGPTPNGGAYFLTVYTDDELRVVPRADATRAIVSEYSADNDLIHETVILLAPGAVAAPSPAA